MNESFILSLIDKLNGSSIVSLEWHQAGESLVLKKKEACGPAAHPPVPHPAPVVPAERGGPAPAPVMEKPAPAPAPDKTPDNTEPAASSADLVPVKSPIVGTFYRAPSPDAPVYVEEGKSVKKGDPLCILEAMKMMNTLESEFDCTVEKILVQNGDLVEFDQPLFLVRKN